MDINGLSPERLKILAWVHMMEKADIAAEKQRECSLNYKKKEDISYEQDDSFDD